jgi:nitroimidazol reductase NimA-like FMN-containing flavoprotein (pyridoxamine 5'-phosphate oxidase superfamily)
MNDQLTLHEMSKDDCYRALREHAFGRLAVDVEDGPTIWPVNYAFVDSSIVIRTAPGSKLTFSPLSRVAFEVDEIDAFRTNGWSVVARGHAFDITTSVDEYSERLRTLPFAPWLSGEKSHVIRIKVTEVTGRRFGVALDAADAMDYPIA